MTRRNRSSLQEGRLYQRYKMQEAKRAESHSNFKFKQSEIENFARDIAKSGDGVTVDDLDHLDEVLQESGFYEALQNRGGGSRRGGGKRVLAAKRVGFIAAVKVAILLYLQLNQSTKLELPKYDNGYPFFYDGEAEDTKPAKSDGGMKEAHELSSNETSIGLARTFESAAYRETLSTISEQSAGLVNQFLRMFDGVYRSTVVMPVTAVAEAATRATDAAIDSVALASESVGEAMYSAASRTVGAIASAASGALAAKFAGNSPAVGAAIGVAASISTEAAAKTISKDKKEEREAEIMKLMLDPTRDLDLGSPDGLLGDAVNTAPLFRLSPPHDLKLLFACTRSQISLFKGILQDLEGRKSEELRDMDMITYVAGVIRIKIMAGQYDAVLEIMKFIPHSRHELVLSGCGIAGHFIQSKTPLTLALETGAPTKFILRLITEGNIFKTDENGANALMIAARGCERVVVEAIMNTALESFHGSQEKLLSYINQVDLSGKSARDYAKMSQDDLEKRFWGYRVDSRRAYNARYNTIVTYNELNIEDWSKTSPCNGVQDFSKERTMGAELLVMLPGSRDKAPMPSTVTCLFEGFPDRRGILATQKNYNIVSSSDVEEATNVRRDYQGISNTSLSERFRERQKENMEAIETVLGRAGTYRRIVTSGDGGVRALDDKPPLPAIPYPPSLVVATARVIPISERDNPRARTK